MCPGVVIIFTHTHTQILPSDCVTYPPQHRCDVSDRKALAAAFSFALSTFGRLDICVNNAGVGELCGSLTQTADVGALLQKVIDIDLTAVAEGTRYDSDL